MALFLLMLMFTDGTRRGILFMLQKSFDTVPDVDAAGHGVDRWLFLIIFRIISLAARRGRAGRASKCHRCCCVPRRRNAIDANDYGLALSQRHSLVNILSSAKSAPHVTSTVVAPLVTPHLITPLFHYWFLVRRSLPGSLFGILHILTISCWHCRLVIDRRCPPTLTRAQEAALYAVSRPQ